MINGSTAFNDAVIAGGYPYTARISHNGTIIDCEVFSCSIFKGSTGNDTFGIGTVFVPYIEMEVGALSTTLESKELKLEVGVIISDSQIEWIDIGYFTPTHVEASTIKTRFTAVGRLATILSTINATVTAPVTNVGIYTAIQNALIAAGYTTLIIDASTVTVPAGIISEETDLSGSVRELLEILTGNIGGYCTEDNAGNIKIFKYLEATPISYDGDRMIAHPIVSNFDFEVSGIKVIQEEGYELDDGTVVPEVAYESSPSYNWVINNEYMTSQAMFDEFCQNCLNLTYRPATIAFAYGDPRLEAFDVLSITDTDNSVYIVPCMSIVHTITGGLTTNIVSPGQSDAEAVSSTKGPITQQIDKISTNVLTAQASALTAKASAEAAIASAALAQGAADQAQGAADRAQNDAEKARLSADTANVATNMAMYQLGVVENIVGVLDMVQKNGVYIPTPDTEVQPNKWYFLREGSGTTQDPYVYKVVNVPPSVYHLTDDVVIDSNKTYYTRSGTGTEDDPYVYTEVENPVVAEIGTYYEKYYELSGIDSTIQNYVSSHLVLTDTGLSLKTDQSRYRIDIAPTGIMILDGDGMPVAEYGETAIIGSQAGFNVRIGENANNESEIGFYSGSLKIAYMNGAELYVTNSLSFGHFSFVERPNGHFTLKLIRGN